MENSNKTKPKVLYVDDSNEYILLFKDLLSSEYDIKTALSGQEGLEILEKEEVQVVISDQRMHEMSGEEFLEKVAIDYPDILRFMISGFTDFEAVVDAVNKGQIQGYFNKPMEPQEISQAINKGLEIAELKKKNKEILQELESTNISLRDADRNKTFFLQILSKELNNPLNELRATVQVLKNKVITEEINKLVNLLDKNVAKFEKLSSLANQLTLLKSNGGELKMEITNTTEVIENLFFVVSEKLRKRNIDFEIKEKKKNILFICDFNLVITCLQNIIDNSLDHTPEGGQVTIHIGTEDSMIYFQVIDKGIKCPEEYIRSTTDFFSTDKETMDLNLNLELLLTKQIMDAHSGRVEWSCDNDEEQFKLLFQIYRDES
jgi:signal transduction histidine kinase